MADAGNIEVHLKNVRLSFPHLFKAQCMKGASPDSAPKFNGVFLLDKSSEQGKKNIAAVKAAIKDAAKARWGDNPPALKPDKFCLRDGDSEGEREEYSGHWFMSASNEKRPTVIDRNRSPLTEDDGKPYSGCYVNAIVVIWAQDNEYGKRINGSLRGVQFYKDGEAFGAAPLSADAFDDLGDEDDGFDEKPREKASAGDDLLG